MGELQTEATVGAAAGVCALTSDSCRKKEMTTTSGRGLHTPMPVILLIAAIESPVCSPYCRRNLRTKIQKTTAEATYDNEVSSIVSSKPRNFLFLYLFVSTFFGNSRW